MHPRAADRAAFTLLRSHPLPLSLCLSVAGVVYMEVRRPCRVMILVNPHSGRGQALQLFTGHIQAMLTEASVPYTLVITGGWPFSTNVLVPDTHTYTLVFTGPLTPENRPWLYSHTFKPRFLIYLASFHPPL